MEKVTGVMVYYYFVCHRKLWYFIHEISMESGSELVGIGKLIDENSYSREKKNILIDDMINVDFLKDWKVVHEVKKSRKIEEASIWQLKYYMLCLEEKGLDIEYGLLDYPQLRKREKIELKQEDRKDLKEVVESIYEIAAKKVPPPLKKKGICKKCAYFELCFV